MYFLPCHLLFYQKWGCIDPVFFPWFRRPWRPVRSRVSVLPAWTLRCCDGLKVKIFRGVDGETTSSMGGPWTFANLAGKLENGKCERVLFTDVYIYTDVYTIIYIWQMNVHWMFFTSQDFLTVYCLDDCSVTIYSTTFWFTILSIILSDCFYTMCNTEGTYECTVFLWSRCWGYLFCLLEIRPIASWGIVFLHNGSPPGKTHVQTKHHPHLNWTSFWLSIL